MTVDDWLIVEWPHSRALGVRWFAYPPAGIPSERERPGLKAFATREEALVHAARLTEELPT